MPAVLGCLSPGWEAPIHVWQKRLILSAHVEQGTSITCLTRKHQVHPVTI